MQGRLSRSRSYVFPARRWRCPILVLLSTVACGKSAPLGSVGQEAGYLPQGEDVPPNGNDASLDRMPNANLDLRESSDGPSSSAEVPLPDGPTDLPSGKEVAVDSPIRLYPVDASPPEVYPGVEAGTKLCPNFSSQDYTPCCPADPPDCTGKPNGYPGYICTPDCANYQDAGQSCAQAWFACNCQNERWMCQG